MKFNSPKWRTNYWIMAAVSLWLLFNLLTLTRSPTVYEDEVGYADPAVNLLLKSAFTSTAWYSQHSDEFWAGNVPGYQFILYLWMRLFGFDIYSVRLLAHFIFFVAAVLLTHAAGRTGLFRFQEQRVILFTGLLFGGAFVITYKSIRPDVFGVIFLACLTYAYNMKGKLKQISVSLIGFFLPWFGLQYLPYFAFIVTIVCVAKRDFKTILSIGVGGVAGLMSLAYLYHFCGVLDDFFHSILPHIAKPTKSAYDFFEYFIGDPGSVILVVFSAFGMIFLKNRCSDQTLRLQIGTILSFVLVPVLMRAVGVYPRYYYWMSAILVLFLYAYIYPFFISSFQKLLTRIYLLIFLIYIASGLPLRAALVAFEWEMRDYQGVVDLVKEHLNAGDYVKVHFQAYYAAKTVAREIYIRGPLYKYEYDKITKLIVEPNFFTSNSDFLASDWLLVDSYDSAKWVSHNFGLPIINIKTTAPYKLNVYYRK